MKFILFFLIISVNASFTQTDLHHRFYQAYHNYKEPSLVDRYFQHNDIISLIEKLKHNKLFNIIKAGESAEKRDIYLIKLGEGSKKVFLWSQMHGDEPTATAALFDILNFFQSNDENFKAVRENILSNLTIYMMPMVNPDGAELVQRRNTYQIDINRDALRQQTPEAKVLFSAFESIKADFGFNLHDQNSRYSVGKSSRNAAISFLAPAFNESKEVNEVRENAIKLIGELFKTLSDFIPGRISRYSDEFETRAFGDNFQKWGMSTILVESGGWKNDIEKQFIRKLNFILLLQSFVSISEKLYSNIPAEAYNSIPLNERFLFDLLLRNLTVKANDQEYYLDLGINIYNSRDNGNARSVLSVIEEVGDFSTHYGIRDYDLTGYQVEYGKVYPHRIKTINEIINLDWNKLLTEGYTSAVIDTKLLKNEIPTMPLRFINKEIGYKPQSFLGRPADLVITKNGKVIYAVVNGALVNVKYGIIYD